MIEIANTGHHEMFIDGAWVGAAGGTQLVALDPATGLVVGTFPNGDERDVDRAVRAARAAHDSGIWSRASAREREATLLALAELIRAHADELAVLEAVDSGKQLAVAAANVAEAAFTFQYYATWATKHMGQVPPVGPSAFSMVVHEPVGVTALIVPWNFPLLIAAQKLAPALAAGCACVLKPAEDTSLSALALAGYAAQAGLPDGVLNVVTGRGETVGAALVRHPGVDKVSFTGSLEVGKQIMRVCADDVKRVTLELGGKSPCILLADADLPAAIEGACTGAFFNAGEVCASGSRVFVQRPIYEEALAAFGDRVGQIRLGHGLEPDVDMGPLVSAAHRRRVLGYLDIGRDEGAQLIARGHEPDDPRLADGFFVAPAVFGGVDNGMRIAREEIFGPVMSVLPFDSVEEVTRQANDSIFGLAASVWTRDIDRALGLARDLRAGNVWINDTLAQTTEATWGGFKQSGIGRELGPWGLDDYLETKHILIRLRDGSER